MSDVRRLFYCAFLPLGEDRLVLDAIRLFAKPTARHAAHVTVRGVYAEYQDAGPWNDAIRGEEVAVGGVERFLGPKQNTVYLGVESDALQALLHKPDYPGAVLHLTVYDGTPDEASLELAEGIHDILKKAEPHFTFRPSGLEPLLGRKGFGELRYSYAPGLLAPFMENPPTLDEIDAADTATRLGWIEQLAPALSTACTA